jgi:nitrogen fixation protein FixH
MSHVRRAMYIHHGFRRMTRIGAIALVALTLIGLSHVASAMQAGGAAPKAAATAEKFDVTLTSTPNPPKTGDNTFAVTVKGPDGKPVTVAEVMAMFYMPAMPAMKMAEMKNNVMLKHEASGRYTGKGQVMMAGKWDVTVMVKRGGKEVASKKFPVMAH